MNMLNKYPSTVDRLEERREVMQRWCDYVELCLRGGADLPL